MAHQGLLSWANSVRLTMVQDPGRQGFKEDVQRNGFLFLDDYLENILSGARQDPLIELVKTPGRKKAIAKKPKLMSSKLGTAMSLSFEDKSENENIQPEEDLQVFRPISAPDKQPGSKNDIATQKPNKANSASRPPLLSIQHVNNDPQSMHVQPVPPPQQVRLEPTLEVLPITNPEHNKDLSVIAEDDEPSERSHASTSAPAGRLTSGSDSLMRTIHEEPPSIPVPTPESDYRHPNIPRPDDATTTSSSSVDTFHSIPLRSPTALPVGEVQESDIVEDPPEGSEAPLTENEPQSHTATSSKDEGGPVLAPQEHHLSPERRSSDKSITPSFPTLPEPMPLRKSMKPPRDPSLNAVMTGAPTPGGPVGGKRTSWLMKAREVKALEGGSKRPFGFATNILNAMPFMPQGTKRKSEEMTTSYKTLESEERRAKIARTHENDPGALAYKDFDAESVQQPMETANSLSERESRDPEPEEVLVLLKKTVEDLGARGSKTLGKSLGGAHAAALLAEARAAAEARVAERGRKEEEMTANMGLMSATSPASPDTAPEPELVAGQHNDGRLSISELFPKDAHMKEKHKAPEKVFTFKPLVEAQQSGQSQDSTKPRESTSTTPPNSPPAQLQSAHIPVVVQTFSKHTPVFIPPAPVPTKPSHVFSPPPQADRAPSPEPQNVSIGLPPSVTFKPPPAMPLTAQSTLESVQSDSVFDREDAAAWMPSTQDTEYTTYDNQTQSQNAQVCDEDDSWPVDEKLSAGVQWTFGGSKEDSMTWSTLPTQSQRGDTGPVAAGSPVPERHLQLKSLSEVQIPGAFDQEMKETSDEQDVMTRDPELEEAVLGVPMATTDTTESKLPPRSQSQMSIASSESSQSQLGFFGQASKLLSSALGTGKKKQPEVKAVLQKAAVAAKKQQEEADKKAARLKEMESRRQLALQRKAEEEKARILEEERKMKEDAERRKKEREGNTEKRALKLPSAKKDEETYKKRKVEVEKKPEVKKPAPSALLGKSHLKNSTKQSVANTSFAYGSLAYAASTTGLEVEPSATYKGKGKDQNMYEDDLSQPSQMVQSQMAARAKAQINASKKVEPAIPSESIELPEINSEYSDSEDEDRVRTFDPPEWAQSPELRQALEMQSTINPDDIFGAVRPLRMEEIFKTRTSRFRARTSSANWSGSDRLTLQEEKEYARRMGFK